MKLIIEKMEICGSKIVKKRKCLEKGVIYSRKFHMVSYYGQVAINIMSVVE